ncbi:PIN domain-like protein [Mycena haematopus]|nr:PIN domain-like protein [Mycena haematopus]
MGVLGLTPFLQKALQVSSPFSAVPDVVKQLPDRLRGLAGKKIVIDGTLITQRLHFAQVPHNYRHVLGWYKLVKELQDSDVSAICVFDGQERSAAKAREAERRRDVKDLAVARGSIELERVKRLQRLATVLGRFQKFDAVQKARISELLRQISSDPKLPPALAKSPPSELLPSEPPASESPPQNEDSAVVSPSNESDLTPVPISPVSSSPPSTSPRPPAPRVSPPTPTPSTPLAPRSSSPTPTRPTISPLERPFPSIPDTLPTEVVAPTVDVDVPVALATLYFGFRESVHKLASLTPAHHDVSQSTDAEQREARVEYSMTKGQIQLTTDEAKLWEELAASSSQDNQVEEQVARLSLRATVMSESYERRNNPPTTQTYDESKELLRTMGVPCIDTTGTYEAEALASSLVLNGFADYVASEDTDVVIYEAPLIRNITNRSSPLMLLSGTEIRAALELDRSSFVDFALLLGTDFSQRIKNVGPVRALKFIRQHKSIERVIEVEKKYTPRVPPSAYLAEVALARLLLEQGKDDEGLSVVLQRFGLGKLLMGDEVSGFEDALQGNYFSDDPSAW